MALISLIVITNLKASGQTYFYPYAQDTNFPSGWESYLEIAKGNGVYAGAGVTSVDQDDMINIMGDYNTRDLNNGCPVLNCYLSYASSGNIKGYFQNLENAYGNKFMGCASK